MDKRIESDLKNETFIKYEEPKFVMYSGTSASMSPFQMFMKVAFNISLKFPTPSSNLYYELHKSKSKCENIECYYIEYYMNDELLLTIGYKEFKNKVQQMIWSDDRIMQYCSPSLKGRLIIIIIAGLVIIISVLFLTLSVLCFKKEKKKKKKKERYSCLDDKEKGCELKEQYYG